MELSTLKNTVGQPDNIDLIPTNRAPSGTANEREVSGATDDVLVANQKDDENGEFKPAANY